MCKGSFHPSPILVGFLWCCCQILTGLKHSRLYLPNICPFFRVRWALEGTIRDEKEICIVDQLVWAVVLWFWSPFNEFVSFSTSQSSLMCTDGSPFTESFITFLIENILKYLTEAQLPSCIQKYATS